MNISKFTNKKKPTLYNQDIVLPENSTIRSKTALGSALVSNRTLETTINKDITHKDQER